jgi:hypothetical protein
MALLQIMDLLDKTVDKTIAFIRADCKENIVSVDINLVDHFSPSVLPAYSSESFKKLTDIKANSICRSLA